MIKTMNQLVKRLTPLQGLYGINENGGEWDYILYAREFKQAWVAGEVTASIIQIFKT